MWTPPVRMVMCRVYIFSLVKYGTYFNKTLLNLKKMVFLSVYMLKK
jgi:hypothetical protein